MTDLKKDLHQHGFFRRLINHEEGWVAWAVYCAFSGPAGIIEM
jgi:hypothetical protein